ncbi:MAG: RteC domain-containing protein, partial [Algoriphagus sp.]
GNEGDAGELSSHEWTDSKSALIELAYALHSRGAVNHGKSDVKAIITLMESLFNVQVGNFYRTFQSMRGRKKNRTIFLDSLKESLVKRMDDTDMGF